MKAQIMMLQKKEAGELTKILEEAIKLTMPGVLMYQEEGISKIEASVLKKKVLAPLELSILADYISYQKEYEEKEREKHLSAILEQIRAVLKDAPILLLDEPDNHLDTEIQESLREILKGEQRIVFFISHRKLGAEWTADKVINLDSGE